MENKYCLTHKAFSWMLFVCEDTISITYFEEDWDGCPWIPINSLLDYMEQSTLVKLLNAVDTFTLEDTEAFDAKQLIAA